MDDKEEVKKEIEEPILYRLLGVKQTASLD